MKTKSDYQALTATDDALKIIRECFTEEQKGDKCARNKTKSLLKEYFIETADGSYTLKSNNVNDKSETMHTHHGAISESMEKFVKPAKLEGKKEVKIMDICSGLGYNAASCIEFLGDDVDIEIDMIEISRETIASSLFIEDPIKSYSIIKSAVENKLYDDGTIGFKFNKEEIPDRININIYLSDARYVIKGIDKKYDAVFLDPFSPLKSPELYTLDFFFILKNILKDDGIILTYTSASPVRSAMVHAGLYVGEGPLFGRKSGGTMASKVPEVIEKSLPDNDERMIALSDAGVPFRDPELNASSDEIRKKREDERKSVRGIKKFASTVKTPVYLGKDVNDPRLERRLLRNINTLGIADLKSKKAKYIICPQFDQCICGCRVPRLDNSYSRINEMSTRLSKVIEEKV
ncbi:MULTISPECIES: MnmC family methyltransferase [Methanobacterium]|uniref:MnmC family methyltransferase n=1 Tax=Methanobacterium veterum TaxID=408577 RepID=A0A9E5A2E1_9EURY|nr:MULTISPECIES: MnmC family methyltransferase [Methanobacterium]MCZ3367462.1 MnmC family methyltransferase [Methanobacterium veterum]MCZ3373390.1 MnmC family methyltransferase [Methanobacterium veterum]